MTILTFPSIPAQSVKFGLQSRTQAFMSKLTSATQTVRMAGAYWKGTVSFNDLEVDQARELQAFLVSLEGMNGRFYLGDLSNIAPSGYMANHASTVLSVVGGTNTGSSLVVDGFPTNGQVAFKAGDLISFEGGGGYRELKMITADATPSGGSATLTVKPNIRSAPADNAVVTHQSATCIMRLASDADGQWSVSPPILSNISLSFVEAVI